MRARCRLQGFCYSSMFAQRKQVTESIKKKQAEFVRAFKTKKYRYLCAAGTTGSGKTFITIGLLHLLCLKIPGVKFFIGRKSEKNLKQTTIPSYIKIKQTTKTSGSSTIVDMVANYNNGSKIVFIWCDITKDPELNNIRGLEVNGGLFEEANQIDRKYFEIAKTRIGRWGRNLCPPFIFLNLNPSLGWVKDLFYDSWSDGNMPDGHYFIEFDRDDAAEASGEEYVSILEDMAPAEYDRFVANRWDYQDIPNQLISVESYKNCIAPEPEININDRALGATDPAWEGNDTTVLARMHGKHIGWFEEYAKQDPDDTGRISVSRAKEHGIKQRDWIVDPIGVGSATVLTMRKELKFEPDLFIAGAPSTNLYGILETYNKRSEAMWLLAELMRKQEITITHNPKFMKQCLAATYFIDDKKIRISDKKTMKGLLNESPGLLDCAMMLVHKYQTETDNLTIELLERQNSSVFLKKFSSKVSPTRNRVGAGGFYD